MVHEDHVALIRNAHITSPSIWADLGSGDGAFTLALRDLGGPQIEIYSVDKNESRLKVQSAYFDLRFPKTKIHYVNRDFTQPLDLPVLDGILMANSLHYVEDKKVFYKKIIKFLKPGGKVIIVEYNVDRGNFWVPHPLSFGSLVALTQKLPLTKPQLLHTVPSDFLNEIYSTLLVKK